MKNKIGIMFGTGLLLLASQTASAVSIRFDFTGKITSSISFDQFGDSTYQFAEIGRAVIGSIILDTDGLERVEEETEAAASVRFRDRGDSPDLVESTFSVDGTNIDAGAYSLNGGGITYTDSHGTVGCGAGCTTLTPDQASVSDGSTEITYGANDEIETYYSRFLSLHFTTATPSITLDYIDFSKGIDALSILTLPAVFGSEYGLSGSYAETNYACFNAECPGNGFILKRFSIESLSRYVVSVPEPATIFLFGTALMWLLVRLKFTQRSAIETMRIRDAS